MYEQMHVRFEGITWNKQPKDTKKPINKYSMYFRARRIDVDWENEQK